MARPARRCSEVLEVLGRMGGEMGRLKDAIHEQSDTIRAQESLIRELQSQVKESRRESDRENKELREELQNTKKDLRQIREQLEAFNAATNSERNSPQASYADVARITPSNISTNLSSPSTRMTPSSFSDTLYCTIDLSRVEDQNRGRAQVGEIRQAVEAEMRAKEGHEGWRCAAVVKDARNAERVKIMCRNETELQRVKDAAQKTAVIGARVMRDQLYPVKVDNANRTAVLDAEGYVLTGAAEALGVENNVTIAKISWLSNKEIGKAYGSMAVYVTKGSDAKKLLDGQYFDLAGESACTSVFEPRKGPVQCYNCQEIGHKAFSCKKPQTCGRCAKPGHHHRECIAAEPKCVPCGGPHESLSQNCRLRNPPRHA
ncbi:reverse transcriptase [Hirsutella rhossiliensis]